MSTRSVQVAVRTTLVLLLAFLLGVAAHAAKFDERLPAPQAVSADELKNRTREYFAVHQEKQALQTPGGFIRDPGAYQKWSDWHWRLTRAMDERKPIGDLRQYGLTINEDGSYQVKLKEFPQWAPLDSRLTILTDAQVFEGYSEELRRRGFREQDIEAMREYLSENDVHRVAFAQTKSITESFAAKVQELDRAKKPIDRELVLSYLYQLNRSNEEARCRWAVGLLDVLDKQRQRILASYFEELDSTQVYGTGVGIDELVNQTLTPIRSGQYIQVLKDKEMELQQ